MNRHTVLAVGFTSNVLRDQTDVNDILCGRGPPHYRCVRQPQEQQQVLTVRLLVQGRAWRNFVRVKGVNPDDWVDVFLPLHSGKVVNISDGGGTSFFVTNLALPYGFEPLFFSSRTDPDLLYLGALFSNVSVSIYDVTPISFKIGWDMEGCVDISMDDRGLINKEVPRDKKELEVVNVVPGRSYEITVNTTTTLKVDVPQASTRALQQFYLGHRCGDNTYDLRTLSKESLEHLRRHKVLCTGDLLRLKQSSKNTKVVESGACVPLDATNLYIVPDFDRGETEIQHVCAQDSQGVYVIEFDTSESFVRVQDHTYTTGAQFSLGTTCQAVLCAGLYSVRALSNHLGRSKQDFRRG
ncbi:FirrV-1-A28 [Feldmannia irregularis virus a]|uniref:FirrV-1-A28 n=1 Tax=Feldmannia irregularis virus a TaxID=231992 RepID=Q6XM59_9PHYC|nr:FirrV-1-A28 [Feldmannia irregularis virus a]AAR26852.1 FirrV-1-A28 [Feldmannia irregularis virus a]